MRSLVVPVLAILSLPLFGQAEVPQDPPWLTALITWAPFIFLIGLWVFFMRKTAWFGKGGYREYIRISQEKMIQIEAHLADIAASLRTLAERERGERH